MIEESQNSEINRTPTQRDYPPIQEQSNYSPLWKYWNFDLKDHFNRILDSHNNKNEDSNSHDDNKDEKCFEIKESSDKEIKESKYIPSIFTSWTKPIIKSITDNKN